MSVCVYVCAKATAIIIKLCILCAILCWWLAWPFARYVGTSRSHINDFFFFLIFVLLAPLRSSFTRTLTLMHVYRYSTAYVCVSPLILFHQTKQARRQYRESEIEKESERERRRERERNTFKTTWVTAERINWCAIRHLSTYTTSRWICEFIIRFSFSKKPTALSLANDIFGFVFFSFSPTKTQSIVQIAEWKKNQFVISNRKIRLIRKRNVRAQHF